MDERATYLGFYKSAWMEVEMNEGKKNVDKQDNYTNVSLLIM